MIVLAMVFYFANVPDIKTEDEYQLDDKADGGRRRRPTGRSIAGWSTSLLLFNAAVLIGACGMIVWVILGTASLTERRSGRL